jgi:hypothetical protein
LFILANGFSELSQVQQQILVAIVFNPLLILCAVGLGVMVIGGLWLLLVLIGGGLGIFFFEVLCPYLFEPLFNKLQWLSDKIGLTPILDKWDDKVRKRRISKKLQKTSYQKKQSIQE